MMDPSEELQPSTIKIFSESWILTDNPWIG